MANYKDVLSESMIQKVFTNLHSLNADYISFEDFVDGYCIVNFKQGMGSCFMSGSILIDEEANVVPIQISNSEQCDGFESIRKGKEGSSLMKITRVYDDKGRPTKYIQYSITLFRNNYNGGRYSSTEEGVYNTKVRWNAGVLYSSMHNIHAVLLPNNRILIRFYNDEGVKRFGIIDETLKGWNNGKWLIHPGFSYIEYKDGNILTSDEDDLKNGTSQIYQSEPEKYEICNKDTYKQIKGCIIRNSEQLIRKGENAGKRFSKLSDKEKYIQNYTFLTDDALKDFSDIVWAYRDIVVISESLHITDKSQKIHFMLPEYRDINNDLLAVNSFCKGLSFDDAYIHHYDYINYLIIWNKLIVDASVFTTMLNEDYADLDYYLFDWDSDGNRMKIKFKELILSSRDNINNILSPKQIREILEHINSKYDVCDSCYNRKELEEIDSQFNGEACIINFLSEGYDCIYNNAILVNRGGEIIDQGFSVLKSFGDDYFIYQKDQYDDIYNKDNCDYYKSYFVIKEQGIIDYKGNVVYKGDFGDLSKIERYGDYLILTKDKFTQLEKDKLAYYYENYMSEESSDDYEYDKNLVDPVQLLLCEKYSEVLNSPLVADGQFIENTPEDRSMLEEYDDDDDWRDWGELEESKLDLDGVLYAVYSISKKCFIIPFQPCKVSVNPAGKEQGIYLANDEETQNSSVGIKYVEKPKRGFDTPLWEKEETCFIGEIFESVFDTFRSGKFVGKTLSYVFKNSPKDLNKLTLAGCIFINPVALMQLEEIYGKSHRALLDRLIINRDVQFYYGEKIYSSNDRIVGHASIYTRLSRAFGGSMDVETFYSRLPIDKVFDTNPQYVLILIKNRLINVDYGVLDGINDNSPYYSQLEEAVEGNVNEQEAEYQDRLEAEQAAWEEEEMRYNREEGYRDAFDNDPEAEWNID